MNKVNLISIIVLLFLSFSFSSCENEPVDPAIDLNPIIPVIPVVPSSFKVTFDSQTYVATQVDAFIADGQISINAYKGAQLQSFTIAITGITSGTYLANENSISYSPGIGLPQLFTSINPNDILENTGQINITSINPINKTITGTFNFKGYYENDLGEIEIKQFTNGVFISIPYVTN